MMVVTKKQKIYRYYISLFRKTNNIRNCKNCGCNLKPHHHHHYFCNSCWNKQ